MANLEYTQEGFLDLAFDPQDQQQQQDQQTTYLSRSSWPLPGNSVMSQQHDPNNRRTTTPLSNLGHTYQTTVATTPSLLTSDWNLHPAQFQYAQDVTTTMASHLPATYSTSFQASPIEYIPASQANLATGLVDDAFNTQLQDQMNTLAFNWANFPTEMINFPHDGMPSVNVATSSLANSSPIDPYIDFEARSLTSSSSQDGWTSIDVHYPHVHDHHHHHHEHHHDHAHNGAVFNPGQTLHIRTTSDSSSQSERNHRNSVGSFEQIGYQPIPSPESDYQLEAGQHFYSDYSPVSPSIGLDSISIKQSASAQRSPASSSSGVSPPPASRSKAKAKNRVSDPTGKSSQSMIRKPSQNRKDNEKRVGRRKGPLRPEQRKQASEIRKIKACLRCRFLKKTCDKGEPCAGCQPSHARLWQVPCTRIDIKDIGFFMKDWKADFERHVTLGVSVGNIKGFSPVERNVYITHGYGYFFPVSAREVFVRDDRCFNVDWVEADSEVPQEFALRTSKLTAGMEGISIALLHEYLDQHLDKSFLKFVDDYFAGTPFMTEILKIAYKYYTREGTPIIRKALKLVLAYALTMHITMIKGLSEEESLIGKITDETSKFRGQTAAPVMINFQVKCALADMWRDLQKEVLEELSSLYQSVYSGDRLKNWPTIFMLAAILLAVWELMQFDCHYRVPDAAAVKKFCVDMESTPVGVIVGLFSAISQKLPALNEWDTRKHHHLLNSNPALCDALTEVREQVVKNEAYLKSRADCKFDRSNFDCLSNKFLSKLVIRAN